MTGASLSMRLFFRDDGSGRSRLQNERISRNLLARTGQKPKSPPRLINLEERTVMDSLQANLPRLLDFVSRRLQMSAASSSNAEPSYLLLICDKILLSSPGSPRNSISLARLPAWSDANESHPIFQNNWRHLMESEVRELLKEELKDAYSAEKQALRCMEKALRKASAPALKQGIELHIEQTQTQIERLEQAMEKMEMKPGRKVCEAMRGLVEEAQSSIEEHEKGPIMDLVIVAGMQRIEHYEISAYGTDIALADALGEKEVSALLTETLEEEKQTDLSLTEITQKNIMPEAMGAEESSKPRQPRAKQPA
jgi:ferritin-like metal-binding protein YciE